MRSGSALDIGFLTEERHVLEPLDEERFNRPGQTLIAVATNCLTGELYWLGWQDAANSLDEIIDYLLGPKL